MQGAPTIPLDVMLWISLGVWALGWLALIPSWQRGRLRRAGKLGPYTDEDVFWRNVACSLLLGGTMGTLSTGVLYASRTLPFAAFMLLCAFGGCAFILIAFRIDAARARRH